MVFNLLHYQFYYIVPRPLFKLNLFIIAIRMVIMASAAVGHCTII